MSKTTSTETMTATARIEGSRQDEKSRKMSQQP